MGVERGLRLYVGERLGRELIVGVRMGMGLGREGVRMGLSLGMRKDLRLWVWMKA